jgi:cupin 2 domain-containing protein
MNSGNIFYDIPADVSGGEVATALLEHGALRIERICSAGQVSPPGFWYDQEEHEWVSLLQGQAKIEMQDGSIRNLSPGDHLFLPAHTRHRVAFTSADPVCIWLAVFWK